jgi:hypothetical protein
VGEVVRFEETVVSEAGRLRVRVSSTEGGATLGWVSVVSLDGQVLFIRVG